MSSIYEEHLDRNPANFVPLSPVSFVERSAEVFGDLPAVVHGARRYTWAQVRDRSARLAAALQALGVGRGSTVSVMLPNTPEMVEAHYAVPALNAVLNTLNTRLDAPLLAWQMNHCEAQVLITDREFAPVIAQALRILKDEHGRAPIVIDVCDSEYTGPGERLGAHEYEALLAEHAPLDVLPGPADEWDAIAVSYTSGTTGAPKGALVPHRALIGNLPGFVCSQNWFGFDPEGGGAESEAVFWSPADWAWTGGLMDALLPTLYFGREIVAYQGRFAPERAFELLQRYRVTHSFLFPTALKAMMKAVPEPAQRYRLHLRAIMSAGEAVGDAVFAYCRAHLGVIVNEMFGQTEINYIVGNCAMNHAPSRVGWPARPGSMGRPYPGHRVAVIDEAGRECPPGTPGEVAVNRFDVHGEPDPVFFLGYWRNEAATRAKYTGDPAASWCRTGDMAVMDADGYLWYQGRTDDMFKAAG